MAKAPVSAQARTKAEAAAPIDGRRVVLLSDWGMRSPGPSGVRASSKHLCRSEAWGIYGGQSAPVHAGADQVPAFDDTGPAAVALTFAVPVWQKLDALKVSAPAQYDAWFVLRAATTALQEIAETKGDEVTQKTLSVLDVLWGAMFEYGETDLLDRLAKVASKLNHEQHPHWQEPAPLSLPALAKQLALSLRLYVDRIGAVDATTEQPVRLTRWQVARYVLARRLLPFVKDASLRADVDALTWAIYERMPLGEDGKPGNGNVTDVANEYLHETFAEDPRKTIAAALRVIASTADANDAIKRVKGKRRTRARRA